MINSLTNQFNERLQNGFEFLGGSFLLAKNSLLALWKGPFHGKLLVNQIFNAGSKSFSLVFITSAAIGMVMTLQFGIGLQKFGGTLYVPRIVALSFVRELGPVFTGLMIAGRVGAGIASEVGSMAVTQQIDAIRALGTSPIAKIVVPRILGTMIALPFLTVFANLVGMIGAVFVGASELGLEPEFFISKILETVTLSDYLSGLVKSVFFAFFISVSGCYYGMRVRKGTQDVGLATTKTVVVASILILVGDFFLTKFIFSLEKWIL